MLPEAEDTYFSSAGWTKGAAFVNGFHLGRFWASQGPQQTLFVPGPRLQPGENEVVILDLNEAPRGQRAAAVFADAPIWSGASPASRARR